MADMDEYTLPHEVDKRLDALLAGWAAASALPAAQAATIRSRVLAEGGGQQAELGVEWWQAFASGLSRTIKQSTLALHYVPRALGTDTQMVLMGR